MHTFLCVFRVVSHVLKFIDIVWVVHYEVILSLCVHSLSICRGFTIMSGANTRSMYLSALWDHLAVVLLEAELRSQSCCPELALAVLGVVIMPRREKSIFFGWLLFSAGGQGTEWWVEMPLCRSTLLWQSLPHQRGSNVSRREGGSRSHRTLDSGQPGWMVFTSSS